jgi:RNA polymerase sigma factor (sigma-70 family)
MGTTTMARRKRGHRLPLTDERRELARAYIPLARGLAARFKDRWPDEWEEFESDALLAVCQAAESFNPEAHVNFATFARFRILGALKDTLRRLGRQRWNVDVDGHQVCGVGHIEDLEPIGVVLNTQPDPETGHDLAETDAVEVWLALLPERHATLCRLIYVEGLSQLDAGRRLELSQSRVSHMHREAIEIFNGTWCERPWPDDAR